MTNAKPDAPLDSAKPRLLILTDIGGDPDDQQSMVRLMTYANAFDIRGLVASASGTPGELDKAIVRPDLIREIVEAYGQVRDHLAQHADGYPEAEMLLARIKSGNPHRGQDSIGARHDTEGSRWIIQEADAASSAAPLNICIWGGQTDLAQALWRARNDRSEPDFQAFVDRIRIYDISDQDGLYDWLRQEFPGLFYLLSKSPKGQDKRNASFRGMYLDGDYSVLTREWIDANVRNGHGPLGALYPPKTWTAPNPHSALKEGDTPSWFYFLPNGLNAPAHPEWGGWGGRFQLVEGRWFRDADDRLGEQSNARIGVARWRPQFQADLQARMDWCVLPPEKTNHPPLVNINGDTSQQFVSLDAQAGAPLRLDASASIDPDGNALAFKWWFYPVPSGQQVHTPLPTPAGPILTLVPDPKDRGSQLHLILEVTDQGRPPLTVYRRIVIDVQ